MKIKVSNKIYIEGADKKFLSPLAKRLTISNPAYEDMFRRANWNSKFRKSLYTIKKEFKYYEYSNDNNMFACGRGNLPYLERHEYTTDFIDNTLGGCITFKGKLRSYQMGVADEILSQGDNGVIKLGTGYGKTIIACELIRKLNKTALIIVPRLSILKQFKDTFKKLYDYEIGTIKGKTWDIKDITVASASTLKKRDPKSIREKFSILIYDEAHTAISDKGIRVVQSFNSKYLYGLTATPRRSDGQGGAIFATFGQILIDRQLPQEKPTVTVVRSDVEIECSAEYHEMIDDMVESEERNELIAKLAAIEVKTGRKVLILTKRVAHFKKIRERFGDDYRIHCISSDTDAKEREVLLTRLRSGEEKFDIILGTTSLLSVGVDIPALDTLIFACDMKSDVLQEQSMGRVQRIFSGKKTPKIIDVDDFKNPILHRQFLKRRSFYKEMGLDIKY